MRDIIYRDDTIEALSNSELTPDGGVDINDAITILTTLPSAKRKTGHWIYRFADNGWADHICSECGHVENTDVHVHLDWKYCPYCGAKMEGYR